MSEQLEFLESLIINGCVHITNRGIIRFSEGRYVGCLKHFEANGCMKVNDVGACELSKFYNLEVLSIRSCDYITDKSIVTIANSCRRLQNLDIQGLDLVSHQAIEVIFQNCINLTSLNCSECNTTPKEFHQILNKWKPPFVHAVANKCFAQRNPETVVQYNRFVLAARQANHASKVIQKFMKATKTAKLLFITKRLQQKHRSDLRRIFNAFRQCIYRNAKQERREITMEAVRTIQRVLPQLYSVHCARRKLFRLRREDQARRLIQRCYRGYICRKRCRKSFERLLYYYLKLEKIFLKYMVMGRIYVMRQRHVKLQAFGRMVPRRSAFCSFRYFVRCLQRRFRLLKRFKQRRIIIDNERFILAQLECNKRDKAARFIQKNWKNRLFNSMMAPFIFFCCIYHRNEYDEQQWCATKIQKVFRGHSIRLKKYKASIKYIKESLAAKLIQKHWRGHKVYFENKYILQHYRNQLIKYRRLFINSRPRLRLGKFARVIQRSYKLYLFRLERYNAATLLQRRYRNYFIRMKWEKLIALIRNHSACVLQRSIKLYLCKLRRRDMRYRQHMAAYRIFVSSLHIFYLFI